MESWLTSLFEGRESFSSPDDMVCTEVSSSFSKEIDDPLYLRRFSQGISVLPGVYSRVTTWMPILNGSLFREVRTPV